MVVSDFVDISAVVKNYTRIITFGLVVNVYISTKYILLHAKSFPLQVSRNLGGKPEENMEIQ